MEITPSRITGTALLSSTTPKNSSRAENRATDSASAVEREAQLRIAAAQHQAEEAERIAESEESQVRQASRERQAAESIRQEETLESLKSKHEQSVTDLKKAQLEELSRVRRAGEDQLSELRDYYLKTAYELDQHGRHEVDRLQLQNSLALNYERKLSQEQLTNQTAQHQKQLNQLKEQTDQFREQTLQTTQQTREKIQTQADEATELVRQRFNDRYQSTLSEQDQIINNLQARASQDLKEIRQDTARKLSAYSTRQEDPFYKLVNLNGRIEDDGENYQISARIPRHEQEHISVVIKGNQLVISGYRRNEEKLEVQPGHSQSTSSYQTFQESFPLLSPVDDKQMTKRFEGDRMIVTLPKKDLAIYHSYQSPTSGKATKIRAEKPVFPENLSLGETSPEPSTTQAKRGRGSRPLG